MKTKITVVGSGYVGMANAVALSKKNPVIILDIDSERVKLIMDNKSPIQDALIEQYLREDNVQLVASTDSQSAYRYSDYVFIATPTDYCPIQNYFNTDSVESVIRDALEKCDGYIVIKSTVPVGFTEKMNKKYKTDRILFSPEFLREGTALLDCLTPRRIVVGGKKNIAKITGIPFKAIDEVYKRGEGAYFSSGSRPNQTASSWARGRLYAYIMGGAKVRKADEFITKKYKVKFKIPTEK